MANFRIIVKSNLNVKSYLTFKLRVPDIYRTTKNPDNASGVGLRNIRCFETIDVAISPRRFILINKF
jgi:hypothetical protein